MLTNDNKVHSLAQEPTSTMLAREALIAGGGGVEIPLYLEENSSEMYILLMYEHLNSRHHYYSLGIIIIYGIYSLKSPFTHMRGFLHL